MRRGNNGMSNKVINVDLKYIFDNLSRTQKEKYFKKTILLTGAAGFLGFYFVSFFSRFFDELGLDSLILLDNFIVGNSGWIQSYSKNDKIKLVEADIIDFDYSTILYEKKSYMVFHMASIASPVYYRKYPIQTIDANITGYRNLLNYFSIHDNLSSMLFFSSSEVYGNPDLANIPTKEDYNGNVSAQGPRACYDESKRLGETLSYVFNKEYNLPIKIVRPFNNYGPGMKINDGRVVSDFARNIINKEDLVIHSNGLPTRTFCYIADSITGFLKVAAHKDFETFNVGNDHPEINILELAQKYKKIAAKDFDISVEIIYKTSTDSEFLTDNPNRRVPNISKARKLLEFNPQIDIETGIKRFIDFYLEETTYR